MLFGRYLLAGFPDYSTLDVSNNFKSTEWLRGEKLCTFRGKYHLAWSVPMADPTYVIPGAAIHSFCMFAPFFALYEKKGMVLQGVFLFVFGLFGWLDFSQFNGTSFHLVLLQHCSNRHHVVLYS